MGEIIDKILFLLFVLPVLMIKDLWERVTKNMTKAQKKKMLWRIPYVLIFILLILAILLIMKGYRWN